MKLSIEILALWVSVALGQSFPECTRTLARTDECASVINANACYNQNRFNGAATLACIDGTNDADRKKKVCQCCTCVGSVMCSWATKQKYC
ncbi:hypothetical protein P280DRAFT_412899 [Massarina eburnea CBS 473.64]|uniref:Uncharacterized protein n=1 Tax=Massarina eburnea CBS 473.64 TaxID=1395130 RepID=A0A6A6RIJ3_9PLEO|nr:hypothetical protein P280DRAFT_412899 [Massarina eburnea CBS 473.64]